MTTSREAAPEPPTTDHAPVRDLTPVVHAVANADLAAYAYLYDTLSPIVHGIAQRVLRDPALAEDVTQDVMLEMWRDAALYVPERGSVRAWAAEAAHRRAVDRLRASPERTSPERGGPDRGGLERRAHPDGDRSGDHPAEHLQDARSTEARDCLRSLSEDERAALVMTYFEGRTCADAAAELGTPATTVANRLATALRHVTRCLGLA